MATATQPRTSGSSSPAVVVAGTALLGLIALTLVLVSAGAFGSRTHVTVVESSGGPGLDAAGIFAHANAGVVDITAHTTTTVDAFGVPQRESQTDTGTGFVIDSDGDLLTAYHVVAGARTVTVAFQDGATRTAKVLGRDPATDAAVLRVDPSGLTLHPLTLGTLSGRRVGDPLAVVGDPFGVDRSLSTGVISGLDRTIQAPNGFSIPHAVQTDAAMNPGNSGGPVLDSRGRVVGIADQIAEGNSGTRSSTGVGFAVSIDVVKNELGKLKAGQTPTHAYLGVAAADATDAQGDAGAIVQSVESGSAAARAGVRPGDLIVELGGTKVTGVNDIVAVTSKHAPGDEIAIVVIRDGRRMTLNATLGTQPSNAPAG